MQRDRAGRCPLVPRGVERIVGVVECECDVEGRAPDQQAVRVDEPPRGEHSVIRVAACVRHPCQQPGAVQRAGRGADDEVKAGRQPEQLNRGGHSSRDHAAHPAALDRERQPGAIGRRCSLVGALSPPGEQLEHGMSHDEVGHCTLQHTRAFARAGPRTRDGPLPPPRRRGIQRLGDIRNIAGHDRGRDPTEGRNRGTDPRSRQNGEDTLLRGWGLECTCQDAARAVRVRRPRVFRTRPGGC